MEQSQFEEMVIKGVKATIAQGEPSNIIGRCYYTHPYKDLCCVIGHMMPPKVRSECDDHMAGSGDIVDLYNSEDISWLDQFSEDQVLIFSKLQEIHDRTNSASWLQEFKADIEALSKKHIFLLKALEE